MGSQQGSMTSGYESQQQPTSCMNSAHATSTLGSTNEMLQRFCHIECLATAGCSTWTIYINNSSSICCLQNNADERSIERMDATQTPFVFAYPNSSGGTLQYTGTVRRSSRTPLGAVHLGFVWDGFRDINTRAPDGDNPLYSFSLPEEPPSTAKDNVWDWVWRGFRAS